MRKLRHIFSNHFCKEFSKHSINRDRNEKIKPFFRSGTTHIKQIAIPYVFNLFREVLLWNADDPNNPITIGYGKITSRKKIFHIFKPEFGTQV